MENKAKILVVDDETAVAMAMVYLLTRSGFGVEAVWKSEQVFTLVPNWNFDLIILDLNMPGMDGFEVCEQIKADPRLRHTPVIFVSGSLSDENRKRAVELGAVDCIAKPFKAIDFISRIIPHIQRKDQQEPDSLCECEKLKY